MNKYEKHPSYGYVTQEEIKELENAKSPWHRKVMFRELKKKSATRAQEKKGK